MNSDYSDAATFVLDEAQRASLLDTVVKTLDQYVFPDVAEQLKADIQERQQNRAYDDVIDGEHLAQLLTMQLQEQSGDRQLRLHFSAQPLPDLNPNKTPSPEALAAEEQQSRHRNFDINRVERLRGNVGYLELYGFEPPEFAGNTIAAAMTFVAQTQALIIDLRHNRGGSPAMVALLCSYLLPAYPAVHLNDLYWRPDDTTRQWWTVSHVPAPRYVEKPVYVLTSQETFSAAEEFVYNLQALKRVVVVGEHTAGGANPGRGYRLHNHFWMFVPTGYSTNPLTGTNWGETGVVPDVKVPSELTLLTAHLMALNKLLETEASSPQFRELQRSMLMVERELNSKRADLISQLKQPNSQGAM
ncbi:S41 family peptidase [Oscillatoria sp. CS-180]|uniref:S41 family peptidase n=1 Tax=Oscillatoria sp. CS-180 TaxID=3021720 RepID=UPI00232CD2A4|nr:S41 family peptidase [Oscillatoria sp. CS-180]MDB9529127.1 S41 family peptidase [Oscillatoria sp. CS-180]